MRRSHYFPFTVFLFTLSSGPLHAQEQQWMEQFGSTKNDSTAAVVPDGGGGVIVAGSTGGEIGGTSSGSFDAFVARHNSAGVQLWARQFGTIEQDGALAMAPDGEGGFMVAGETRGDLGSTNAGARDAFIARFDGDGNLLWMRQFGTADDDFASALAPDAAGGVMVAGGTTGDLSGPNAGSFDTFIARYDGSGNQLWIHQIGDNKSDYAKALAPDGVGGCVVVGVTSGSLGGPNAGGSDGFLARYDNAGNELWITHLGSSGFDFINAAAPDGSGGVMIAGSTLGTLGVQNAGSLDAFIARYDDAGNQLWLAQFGTANADGAAAVSGDGAGGAMIAGYTAGSLGGPNPHGNDAILARYDGEGNQLWLRQFGTEDIDEASAITTDGAESAMVAGRTDGSLGGPNAGEGDVFLARYSIGACYADCDKSTGNGVLDVFDFLCFQSSFVNAEPYACDCDTSTGPGVCDVFDFLCFQTAFVKACS